MAETVNKRDMLSEIEQSYAALEAALATLDSGQMTAPLLAGGWSVKDTLAHLSVWHRRALDIIDPLEPPRVPGIPAGGIADAQINEFNAQFYAQHRDQPLAEALAAFRESYRQLLASARRLTEPDLMRLLAGETHIWQVIAANTYWHYPEHLEAIQAAFA
ncbi:MAG TPA: ClbS/DfsB family four-helix bundle protein [Ktedonobacterales bacterium]|jgi:uncharacterized protein (TIGR03083 family)